MRGEIVGAGDETVRARARPPGRDTQPLTLIQSSSSIAAVDQAAEPVPDRQQRVAAVHPDPHGDAHGGVHPWGGLAGVEHGEAQGPLPTLGVARPGLHDRAQQPVRVGEAAAAHRHRGVEVPIGDQPATDRVVATHSSSGDEVTRWPRMPTSWGSPPGESRSWRTAAYPSTVPM